MNTNDYLQQLRDLLPPGPAWPRASDALITRLLTGIAEELARLDARIASLLNEADPRLTTEMLTDWERLCGLPDACTGQLVSRSERRDAVVARLTMIGGQSIAYFVALAKSLGYTVTVTEYRPYTVRSKVCDPICDGPWRYVFRVNAPLENLRRFSVRSGVNEPLAGWGNDLLECVIRRLKPAHTHVLFGYS